MARKGRHVWSCCMKKKWVIGVAVVCATVATGWMLFGRDGAAPTPYIIGPEVPVKFSDAASAFLVDAVPDANGPTTERIGASPNDIASGRTLALFKKLQLLFNESTDLDDHFSKVATWLHAFYPEEEAQKIMALYREYLTCEKDLAAEYLTWGTPTTPEEIIDMLRAVQEFRRERLGAKTADLLYGVDVKSREYRVRKGAVIQDSDLYGAEKEARIARLNEEMWGDAELSPDLMKNNYNRYQEKLALYSRDLSEATSDENKAGMISAFRQTYFSPDVVEKLEEVDARIETESENEAAYFKQEGTLRASKKLSPDEKAKAIAELQNRFFGEGADAFRRLEAKRIALEKMAR